jgi:hypothetical protein
MIQMTLLGQELRLILDLAGQRVDFVGRRPLMRLGVVGVVLIEALGKAA